MNYTDYKKKATWMFISAALSGILVLIFFYAASKGEDSYKYLYDEDYRDSVKLMNVLGWISLLSAGCDLIMGAVYWNQAENVGYNVNMTYCPDCHKMISKNATHCPNCGRPMNTGKSSVGAGKPATQATNAIPAWKQVQMEQEQSQIKATVTPPAENIPAWKRAQMTAQTTSSAPAEETSRCIFCNAPIYKGQVFCGACGRRQD